jgi:hypothetical protein
MPAIGAGSEALGPPIGQVDNNELDQLPSNRFS